MVSYAEFVLLYFFLFSPSFGASGGLYFVIVAFPGYLHLYFFSSNYLQTGLEIFYFPGLTTLSSLRITRARHDCQAQKSIFTHRHIVIVIAVNNPTFSKDLDVTFLVN